MVVVNLVLIRRAVTPLVRLTDLMRDVDPLQPGERMPPPRAESEVTVLAETFNEMLDRLETERRESRQRALSEREAERRRIAGELHDEIGQTLTALGLQLDRLRKRSPMTCATRSTTPATASWRPSRTSAAWPATLRPEALDTLGLPAALTNLASA